MAIRLFKFYIIFYILNVICYYSYERVSQVAAYDAVVNQIKDEKRYSSSELYDNHKKFLKLEEKKYINPVSQIPYAIYQWKVYLIPNILIAFIILVFFGNEPELSKYRKSAYTIFLFLLIYSFINIISLFVLQLFDKFTVLPFFPEILFPHYSINIWAGSNFWFISPITSILLLYFFKEKELKDLLYNFNNNQNTSTSTTNDNSVKKNISKRNEAIGYLKRGNREFKNREYLNAIKYYTKAIELDPNFKEAYGNRGIARKALGDNKGYSQDRKKS
tara:strand:+ start:62 stop:886 length:825 start_codon:yes stop_codon:yes gene_type:complete